MKTQLHTLGIYIICKCKKPSTFQWKIPIVWEGKIDKEIHSKANWTFEYGGWAGLSQSTESLQLDFIILLGAFLKL